MMLVLMLKQAVVIIDSSSDCAVIFLEVNAENEAVTSSSVRNCPEETLETM